MLCHNSFTMLVNEYKRLFADFSGLQRAGRLFLLVSIAWLFSAGNVYSCEGGAVCDGDLAKLLQIEEAVKQTADSSVIEKTGVKISVDGDLVTGSVDAVPASEPDLPGLEAVDIHIKYDGLDENRRLVVSTVDNKRSYSVGEEISFIGSWNYGRLIERAEIRVYKSEEKRDVHALARPVSVIPIDTSSDESGFGHWTVYQKHLPNNGTNELVYTLRVYDVHGRFDETNPMAIQITQEEMRDVSVLLADNSQRLSIDENLDQTAVSNIPLVGGQVTVHGRNIPAGYKVSVAGEPVWVDATGSFVTDAVLPPGEHKVDVLVHSDHLDDELLYTQDINIPDNEWFYVGLADLTVGRRFGKDSRVLNEVQPGEYRSTFNRGRLAFYLKGKIRGDTLLTAALDTTDEEVDVIFSNLDKKDPRQLLRRIDPDDHYPIYGDDSTTVEDAPTSGRFYVRLERGRSHVLWGNFKARINGNELARFERGLYGAHARIASEETTSHGEPVASVEAFAAQPGTLPQRDEFRGTGGSAYFLKRQDINRGSEQVYIEERGPVSGTVINRTFLVSGQDYEFDHVQGVVILSTPLASTTGVSGAVRTGSIGGNHLFLVTQYEYTPTLTDVEGHSAGGRAEGWITDSVRLGVTGYSEDTGLADQDLYGADMLLRLSHNSTFKLEWAQSSGNNFAMVTSTDGGFIFNPVSTTSNGRDAQAFRALLNLDLGEITYGATQGSLSLFYEDRESGFNAPGRYTAIGESLWGGHAKVEVDEDTDFSTLVEAIERDDGSAKLEVTAEVVHRLDERNSVTVGVIESRAVKQTGIEGNGNRTDLGLRLDHQLSDDEKVWVFGQATVERSGTFRKNDRYGVGIEKRFNDKLHASLEVSDGTSGIGGAAAIYYQENETDQYHLGYRLDPLSSAGDVDSYDPFGRDYGSLVYGMRRNLNDQTTFVLENNYDFMGTQQSITQTYGLQYAPDDHWTYALGLEAGEVQDSISGDFERFAISGTTAFKSEEKSASLRLEARFEDSTSSLIRDRETYLIKARTSTTQSDDWRFLASFDAVISHSGEDTILDGDYVEASLGWAYRPVESDRFNMLAKYTYLRDLPGAQQVNTQNQVAGPLQRSHVFSADFVYDLNKYVSVGGKYGFRIGEVATDRSSANFNRSSAHLGIIRSDLHIVHEWDALIEARALRLSEVDQLNVGFLAGVYKHLGDTAKLGVGYNFGQFSDDLTDLTLDDEGVFVNLIGKF